MKIQKNEVLETPKRKSRSINPWSMILILTLLASFFVLHSSPTLQVALADEAGEGVDHIDVTFTKWVTTVPAMAGIVGGDAVGSGAFVGEIIDFAPDTVMTRVEALYHINGGTQTFTAHVFVWQDEVARTAEVRGVVTEGWMQGSLVHGTYAIISCPDKTDGQCYQGALEVDVHTELEKPEASA